MTSMPKGRARPPLLLSEGASIRQRMVTIIGESFLFMVAASSLLAVLFIMYFIGKDAIPFFWVQQDGYFPFDESLPFYSLREGGMLPAMWGRFTDFFAGTEYYATKAKPSFGSLPIFYASFLVTFTSSLIAVPLGVCAAICLSDLLPFWLRQFVKPVIEILASIPSVAWGFFALVVIAPLMQNHGGTLMLISTLVFAVPLSLLGSIVAGDLLTPLIVGKPSRRVRIILTLVFISILLTLTILWAMQMGEIQILQGTNALNVSFILAIMALPTIVSVSEDALQAAGIELRMASYGLGATRAETLLRAIIPAASSGILAGVILGIMRAVGETMVVVMAAGGSKALPEPLFNLLAPIRPLTSAIAIEMGEAQGGSLHFYCLFLMALSLLIFCFVCNLASEWVIKRNRKKLKGEI